jgi:hypothetical protein
MKYVLFLTTIFLIISCQKTKHYYTVDNNVVLEKDAKEKFGRYLAWIYYQENAEWVCINNKLIDLGLAEPYM